MVGDHAIILDERADRYTKLDRISSQALKQCLAGIEVEAAPDPLSYLLELGVIVPAHDHQLTSVVMPPLGVRSIDHAIGQTGSLRPIATAFHLAAARRQLHAQGLAATLAEARQRAARCQDQNDDRAAAIARNFRVSRGWLPFPRACLPDSLALHAMLCRRSVRSTLVIGVRDYPFSAHCWVQSGSLVLTDQAEELHALVQILAL
jgi:hypothetical protein